MHISNCTQQFHIFRYRVAESPRDFEREIPPGGQITLLNRDGTQNLSTQDVAAVVSRYEPYGMIAIADIGRIPGKHDLVYSLDRPASFLKITEQIERNRTVMILQGKRSREAAAVASNERLSAQVASMTGQDVMQNLTVEIEQEKRARVVNENYGNAELARQLADAPAVAEGIRIDHNAPPPTPAARPRRAPRRAH
jgi:hypothetical protein